jgi:hypothetical protein
MMQAKDITDEAMISAIVAITDAKRYGANNNELEAYFPYAPAKVLRAKCRKLILKGKITGCACGCRGDYLVNEYMAPR